MPSTAVRTPLAPPPARSRLQLDAARTDLDEAGFCIVRDVLTPDEVGGLRHRLVDQAEGERARGVAFHDGGPGGPNQRVWMLINKGRVFRDLMLHPLVTDLIGHLLGPDFLLSSLTANIAGPGGEPMVLHVDQGWSGMWTAQPLVANIAWMIDDFTADNGATRLAPGSHLDQTYTPRSSAWRPEGQLRTPSQEETVAAEGPAGSILVFDGRVWHGTGANTTRNRRHALLSYHCRPFIRQQENFALGLRDEIRLSERPELLKRLGFTPWSGLGRVEHPRPQIPLFETPHRIGPLNATGAALPEA